MLSTTKPFAIRRIKRSATNKLMFVVLLAVIIFCIPSAIFAFGINTTTEMAWILQLFAFSIALFIQLIVVAILYILMIGKVLLSIYLIPFYFLLKHICNDDERYILKTDFGIQ